MKNLYKCALVALAFISASAFAGLTQPQVVVIDMAARTAMGDMVSARTAANELEFIGCGIRHLDDGAGGAFELGFCQAGDAGGQIITCATQNPGLLKAIAAMTDSSYVTFDWDESEFCTRIGNSAQSFYLPKNVKGNN